MSKKVMRWGILLFLCYGATLIQLMLIRKQNEATKTPPSLQLQAIGIANFTMMKYRAVKAVAEFGSDSLGGKIQNVSSYKDGHHLYVCQTTDGRKIKLPRVPHFIIGGTQKGGTTALMKLIKMHPLIVDSTSFESHFFDYDERVKKLRGLENIPKKTLCELRAAYAYKHFPLKKLVFRPELLSFEKTPAYILDESTPARIKAITPWAKVIFSLRNPIDRAFSHYRMLRTRNQIPETDLFEIVLATDLKVLRRRNFTLATGEPFPEMKQVNPRRMHHLWKAKNLVYRGLYADQLRPWLKHFTVGKDLLVVRFERILENPHVVLDEILNFLGVHRHSYNSSHFNESYSPVIAKEEHVLKDATRDYLLRLYEPYNLQLVEMLGEAWRNVWNTSHY